MKLPRIIKIGVFTFVALGLATSRPMAEYLVNVVHGRIGGTGGREWVAIYNTAEVNSLISASANTSLNATNNAVSAARSELKTDMASVQVNVQKQVTDALAKIPTTLFSEEAKKRLSSQIAEELGVQTKAELDRFKADFKDELLKAMDAKISATEQPR